MKKIKGFIVAISLIFSSVVYAQSSVWEVSHKGNRVILAGTVHMLKASDYPLPDEYAAALAESDVVVFETDMLAVQDPVFGMQVAQAMILEPGQTLQSVLKPETWQALQSFAAERSLPLDQLGMFKPAFVGLTFTVLEMQKLGFAEGVDMHYFDLARRQEKAISFLETPDEQLQFLLAMTEVDPDAYIEVTLEDLANIDELLDDTVAAWRAGDADKLDELMGERMRKEAPELYDVMLVQRNANWIEQIEAMLKTSETHLVLVGAMHLAGADSVQRMLEKRGFKVRPYQVSP